MDELATTKLNVAVPDPGSRVKAIPKGKVGSY